MQCFPISRSLVSLLSLAACLAMCAGVRPALAQIGSTGATMPSGSNPSSLVGPMQTLKSAPAKPAGQAPPDVLPGAATQSDRVAPAKGGPIADPTEALFDAINRGDIASAKDAIDRGADLDGHSVLGMTPLDQSVDLGRNDITFLLLSLQNGDAKLSQRASTQTAQTGPAGKPASAQGAASRKGSASARGLASARGSESGKTLASANTTRESAKAKVSSRGGAKSPAEQAASTAPVGPRLFAGDGGTPNPAAGFLGFDTRH
jgi:hypothetical protein